MTMLSATQARQICRESAQALSVPPFVVNCISQSHGAFVPSFFFRFNVPFVFLYFASIVKVYRFPTLFTQTRMLRCLVVVANGRITIYLYLRHKNHQTLFFHLHLILWIIIFFCFALNCTLKFLIKVGSTSRKLQYISTAFSLFASNCWFKDCWIWRFYFRLKKFWL